MYTFEYDASCIPSMPVVRIWIGKSNGDANLELSAIVDSGAEIKKTVSTCTVEHNPSKCSWWKMSRICKLKNQDEKVFHQVRAYLISVGWELLDDHNYYASDPYGDESSYQECTFRRYVVPPTSQTGRISDIADQLEKLANLRRSGALTGTEFEAAKRKLLGT